MTVRLTFILICATQLLLFCGNSDASNNLVAGSTENVDDSTVQPTGAIAFIRNGEQIRSIQPDGSKERLLWQDTSIQLPNGIHDLAWRPDGRELSFSSSHAEVVSFFHSDLYAIRPDGSGLRKITNAPLQKDFSKYKKGTVTVIVTNNHYSFNPGYGNAGAYAIYVAGAPEPQPLILPPGATKAVTFRNVADFGDHAQGVVVMYGANRWFGGLDVVAGQTTQLKDFTISGDGVSMFGAYRHAWNHDGTSLSFNTGLCFLKTTSATSTIDPPLKDLFNTKEPISGCIWAVGPTAATKDQVLFTNMEGENGSAIYLGKIGGAPSVSNPLHVYSKGGARRLNDLEWLPDGSGFIYSYFTNYTDLYEDESRVIGSDLFHYDLKTNKLRQITKLKGGLAGRFSISPDGQRIVFEKGTVPADVQLDNIYELDEFGTTDLYIVNMDGSGERLLVKNASAPAWSR